MAQSVQICNGLRRARGQPDRLVTSTLEVTQCRSDPQTRCPENDLSLPRAGHRSVAPE
jgi:hypothetical protein